jgi:hypothetical protein
MRKHATALVLCAVFCASALAQQEPSEVTDKEIERYKAAAKDACMQPGLARGDPREKVEAVCSCIIGALAKSMSRSEWQQAYFYSTRKQADEERRVINPHLPKPELCRPPD